jgi:hypothetical protein
MILDRLPLLLDKGGDAGQKMLSAVFNPLGTSLGAIKNVSIVEMGNSGNGKGGVEGFVGAIPGMVSEFFLKAKASGVDVTPLLNLLKMDPTKLAAMAGIAAASTTTDIEATPAAAAAAKK